MPAPAFIVRWQFSVVKRCLSYVTSWVPTQSRKGNTPGEGGEACVRAIAGAIFCHGVRLHELISAAAPKKLPLFQPPHP